MRQFQQLRLILPTQVPTQDLLLLLLPQPRAVRPVLSWDPSWGSGDGVSWRLDPEHYGLGPIHFVNLVGIGTPEETSFKIASLKSVGL